MIQASLKILILFAIVAIIPSSGQLLADAPKEQPRVTDQSIQNRLQQVGHEIQQAECTTGSCNSYCQNGSCDKCRGTACDSCKKRGLFGWLKSAFCKDKCHEQFCDFNMNCNECRRLGRRCGKCNGKGVGRPPFGCYQMVYPVNPAHCDPRDRNVHAAQGYGVPMTVPLAPVVRHQYNYSWGVPASRLTPISNYVPGGVYNQGYNGQYYGQQPGGYCPSCQPATR